MTLARRHWLLLAISALALAWAIGLLWRAWPEVYANLARMQAGWLALVVLGASFAACVNFEVFNALFAQLRGGAIGRLQLAHLHFTAQLMRHLPGRVWGVAYQSATGGASVAEWVGVNAMYTVLSSASAVWISLTIYSATRDAIAGTAVFALGALAYFVCWSPRVFAALTWLLSNLPFAGKLAAALSAFGTVPLRLKWRLLLLLTVGWAIYYASWAGYGLAWPGLAPQAAIAMAALYTLAWLIGYLSFVTPSGVGVREFAFVLLAQDYPPDAVAAMAVFGRIILLLVDVVLAATFSPFSLRRSAAPKTD
jgi:hypothetical protein